MINLLAAIGECHRQLKQHAIHLCDHIKVRDVVHVIEMPELFESYRLQEYVDAELVSGEAISWCLEITLTKTTILVEADVRRIHSQGQDIIDSIGEYEYSTEAECASHLTNIVTQLCSANPL